MRNTSKLLSLNVFDVVELNEASNQSQSNIGAIAQIFDCDEEDDYLLIIPLIKRDPKSISLAYMMEELFYTSTESIFVDKHAEDLFILKETDVKLLSNKLSDSSKLILTKIISEKMGLGSGDIIDSLTSNISLMNKMYDSIVTRVSRSFKSVIGFEWFCDAIVNNNLDPVTVLQKHINNTQQQQNNSESEYSKVKLVERMVPGISPSVVVHMMETHNIPNDEISKVIPDHCLNDTRFILANAEDVVESLLELYDSKCKMISELDKSIQCDNDKDKVSEPDSNETKVKTRNSKYKSIVSKWDSDKKREFVSDIQNGATQKVIADKYGISIYSIKKVLEMCTHQLETYASATEEPTDKLSDSCNENDNIFEPLMTKIEKEEQEYVEDEETVDTVEETSESIEEKHDVDESETKEEEVVKTPEELKMDYLSKFGISDANEFADKYASSSNDEMLKEYPSVSKQKLPLVAKTCAELLGIDWSELKSKHYKSKSSSGKETLNKDASKSEFPERILDEKPIQQELILEEIEEKNDKDVISLSEKETEELNSTISAAEIDISNIPNRSESVIRTNGLVFLKNKKDDLIFLRDVEDYNASELIYMYNVDIKELRQIRNDICRKYRYPINSHEIRME